eukprot:6524144-Heterocapsa_arctica.AAC.1
MLPGTTRPDRLGFPEVDLWRAILAIMIDFHRLRKLSHAPSARQRAIVGLADLAGRTWAAVHTELES